MFINIATGILCIFYLQCWRAVCSDYITSTAQYMPSYLKLLKTHLVLHLVSCIVDFGPTECYNTERLAKISFV